MAKSLVRWKAGKTGFYETHVMRAQDWKRMGFEGDDGKEVVFNRDNNFAVVGDNLPAVQMDFFENSSDYEVKTFENAEDGGETRETKAAAAARQALTGQGGRVTPRRTPTGGNKDDKDDED
jgi:hypothetical protein